MTKRLPYPGLRAFTRDESDLFFGREGCVDAMVDRLAATRFLAVLGLSGSGKSSLVRTGLLDALDLGLHPCAGSHWKVVDMHPGGQPIRNLAAALLEAKTSRMPDATDVTLLTAFLGHGPRSVVEWASGGNLPPDWNLLIMVDQFEELFRYGDYAQREEAEAFVALLLESAATPGVPIHVVVTMRSEYLGACTLIPGLAERINVGLYLTPRMGREECHQAIEGPAGVIGFKVEPALVNRLLNDLASFAPWEEGERSEQAERLSRQADQLPVMQHVLNRLWVCAENEADGAAVELSLADYERIGGVSGALDAHGAEIMAALGDGNVRHIEEVFRALVSGASVAVAVRRPCRMSELVEVAGGARDHVVSIVEAFRAPGCNFMRTSEQALSNGDAIVDLSHESLIRQWTPLRKWLEREARDGAAWRRVVSAEERYKQGEGGLLKGPDLHSLAAWWESANPTSAWASRHGGKFQAALAFLEASRRAEAAQADAERRHQMSERKRLRIGLAGLAAALAIVTALSVFLLAARHALEAQKRGLETANTKLEAESEKARRAEQKAIRGLDAANKAKEDAVRANQETQDALARVHDRETRLKQVGDVVHSQEFKKMPGAAAMMPTLESILGGNPHSSSFAFAAAVASTNVGRLNKKNPLATPEAEINPSKAIERFEKGGAIHDPSKFSEDFSAYCGAYSRRAEWYAANGLVDPMLADIEKMEASCKPALNNYPWDFHLRQHFRDNAKLAGQVLFERRRYKEALPYLEYASHWAIGDSSRLLAQMYQEGLGVSKDEQKAKALETLAGKQTTKTYTLAVNFPNGKKPFEFSLSEWPPDYPFEGIDDQVKWLKEARGGTVSPEVIDVFHNLQKLARDNNVSFPGLVAYALNELNKDAAKEKEAKKPAPVKPSQQERAMSEYRLAQSLVLQSKWEEAAQAVESALNLDPEFIDGLELAEWIYHERLFKFDRAFELNAKRVELGTGELDFVEKHLTTARFEACVTLTFVLQGQVSEKRLRTVLPVLRFACLTGEQKTGDALAAGRQLRKEAADLESGLWSFAGTKHFVSGNPAFATKADDWVRLFDALEKGDKANALEALAALGVRE